MNPLSALIGGAASLAGSWMNSSSQQAINTQNLQATEYVNQGMNLNAYYRNLRGAADAAGFNPLALIGARGPDVGFSAGAPSPGAGLEAVGRAISQVDPRADELVDAQIRKAEVDIANGRTLGTNAAIQGERQRILNHQLEGYIARHPYAIPEGLQFPTSSDVLEELRTDQSAFAKRFGDWFTNPIKVPQWLGGGM